jgi:aminoglycoside phosphotransferase (APT) family kinase protein
VFAATAWHWVDPEVRYSKAAAVLRPRGHLALWGAGRVIPYDGDPFFEEIQEVYEARPDVSQTLREAGSRFVGKVEALEREEASIGRRTLIHGDASLRNVRTAPDGQVAFVDWEDVRLACGAIDLTWLLVSSVEPRRWAEVAQAYGLDEDEMGAAFGHAVTQGILSFSEYEPASQEAAGWAARLEAAACCLG